MESSSSHGLNMIEIIETEFDKLTENPEIYVEPQLGIAEKFKQLSEKSYQCAFKNNKNSKGKFLPKLLIEGFDAEQVWQQCDLLNKAVLIKALLTVRNINCKDVSHALSVVEKSHATSSVADSIVALENEDCSFSDEESDIEGEEYAFDDDSDSEMNAVVKKRLANRENKKSPKAPSKIASDSGEDAISSAELSAEEEYAFDDDSDSPSEKKSPGKKKVPVISGRKKNRSIVDDKFFKLSKLDEFLKIEDLKEERKDEVSDSDSINLFEDIPSDDEDEKEGMKSSKSSKDIMYGDFFDEPDSDSKDIESSVDDDESIKEENDEASFQDNDSAVEMKDLEEENEDSDAGTDTNVQKENKTTQKSAFELEQEKIRKQIKEYEKSLIEPLPWHLTGEVDASKRPTDSLIHKETDFDSNVKEELLVDSVLTETIEEITIMVIRNKAFSDVERKHKPTEDVIAYKKEVALEQTKSKKGLAEVYEEEYLKKQSNQNVEEEDQKHKEIKKLEDSLYPELYALISHIPVPAVPELKVISNLPAVTVEEVAPTKVSDATLLAPEEVKKKSGQIKSQTERTETDRKRERRKKKIHQKLKEKKRLEKLESLKGNPSAKVTKLEKLQTLKKIKQHKNTKIASVDAGGKIKSSKDFFSRLQDTVDSRNKPKSQNFSKKRMK